MLCPSILASANTRYFPNADDCNITNVNKFKENTLSYTTEKNNPKSTAAATVKDRATTAYFCGQAKYEDNTRVGTPANPPVFPNWLQNPKVDTVNGNENFWNRGHLVGNQFGGETSNNAENIVPETEYLNQTLMTHWEGTRKATGFGLNNWLHRHPHYYLDYQVTPIYQNANDKVPEVIELAFRGVKPQKDSNKTGEGTPVRIYIPKLRHQTGVLSTSYDKTTKVTTVHLANIEPGYVINYQTGAFAKDPKKSVAQWKAEGVGVTMFHNEHHSYYHHFYYGHHHYYYHHHLIRHHVR